MFDPQFLDLMPYTVTLTSPTGRNAQGQPTFVGGTARAYRCRIVGDILALRDAKMGVESQAFVLYMMTGDDPVTTDDRITLPVIAAFGTGTPFIFAVERFTDEGGQHHTKLICGYTFHHQTSL